MTEQLTLSMWLKDQIPYLFHRIVVRTKQNIKQIVPSTELCHEFHLPPFLLFLHSVLFAIFN